MNVHKLIFSVVLYFLISTAIAQIPKVPSKMTFAGMDLKINEAARKKIQESVDALMKSEKYFNIKLERVNLYMPIIERVFREENFPEDFKYLCIQESALISDAVSSSNAVGFWQFKKESAEEVGLNVGSVIDERKNIEASSRAATKYLKRNNFYFNNWVYALLAYNTGAGGAKEFTDEKNYGAKKMDITKNTHWYVLKFLAHKVTFQHLIGKKGIPEMQLGEYTQGANKSLKAISKELGVDGNTLIEYNKWIEKGKIPEDKTYTVIVPISRNEKRKDLLALVQPNYTPSVPPTDIAVTSTNEIEKEPQEGPSSLSPASKPFIIKVNGLSSVVARAKDNIKTMAKKGGLTLDRFLKYNDLSVVDTIIPGQVYYITPKRSKAKVHYHTVKKGETAWEVSQKYGIKLKKLRKKNHLTQGTMLQAGTILWLQSKRPAHEALTPRSIKEIKKIEEEDSISYTSTLPIEEYTITHNDTTLTETSSKATPNDTTKIVININPPADTISIVNDTIVTTQMESINSGKQDPQPIDTEATQKHIVKKGETLFSVSQLYQVPVDTIIAMNNIIDNAISIDQTLILPKTSLGLKEGPVEENKVGEGFLIYEVKPGETLYNIARTHDVTIKEMMEWNNKSDFTVSAGEKLKIQKKSSQ